MSEQNLPVDLVISGASGRMGKELLKLAAADRRFQIAGALEQSGHPAVGEAVSSLGFDCRAELTVSSDIAVVLDGTAVLVDFTRPEATRELVKEAIKTATPAVIGTTGLSRSEEQLIERLAAVAPVVSASNMSVGINLLRQLVVEATESFTHVFDVEIVEMHHRHKEDAPSGTALALVDDIAGARRQSSEAVRCCSREGFTGERDDSEIGVFALRGGDVAGDHTVIFAGEGERLEFTHRASGRETFARGALLAVEFVSRAEPGLYGMPEVLGLNGSPPNF